MGYVALFILIIIIKNEHIIDIFDKFGNYLLC